MNRRNELRVRGDGISLLALMGRFERTDLLEDWVRDEAAEQRLNQATTQAKLNAFCFQLRGGPLRPVSLILQANGFADMRVTLIMTIDGKPQSDTEYNRVLGDFLANVLVPLSVGLKLEFVMEPPRAELGEFVSPDVVDRLREFLVASTEEGQVYAVPDHEKWTRFIIQAHRDQVYIGNEELEYWLKLQGFSDGSCESLLDSYVRTEQVLREYDRETVH